MSEEPSSQNSARSPAEVQRRLLRMVCTLQLLASWIAGVLSAFEVESIIGTMPAIVVTCLIVIMRAKRRTSWLLMCFGLSGLWAVSVTSLTIATFSLSPGQAVPTVPALLFCYASLLTAWYYRVYRLLQTEPELALATRRPVRYSMKGMMLFTTAFCLLAALAKIIPWQASEMWAFGSGGFVLLGISLLFAIRFETTKRESYNLASPTEQT